MKTFKNLIAPFQRVLLAKRLCPGCTAPLDKMQKHPFNGTEEIAICSCRRMFVYDRTADSYRRATFREAEEFSKRA